MNDTIRTHANEGGTPSVPLAWLAGLGTVQGLLVWAVTDADLGDRLTTGLVTGLVLGPLAFALLTAWPTRPAGRVAALSAATGLVAGLLAGFGGASEADGSALWVVTTAAIISAGLVALTVVLVTRGRDGGRVAYPRLFGACLDLPVTLALAGAFAGVVWAIAWLVAALFAAIGMGWLEDILSEGWFASPYLFAAWLCGIGVVRGRASVTGALQDVVLAMARLVAPVLAVAVAVFAVALAVQGLGVLWDGLSPVATLTATAVLAGLFVNACVGAVGAPARLSAATARLLCLTLPLLMGLAAYGMHLRIVGEGLTPERLYALVIVAVMVLASLLYAGAGALGAWSTLRRVNVGLLLLVAGVAAALQTPLFRPVAWSAQSQAERLLTGEVAPEAFDFAYLRFDLGAAGQAALDRIKAAEPALAARIDALDAYENRYEARAAQARAALLADADWLTVRPAGAAVPPALAEAATGYHRRGGGTVLLAFPDGAAGETAWLAARGFGDKVVVEVHRRTGEDWTELGHVVRETDDPEATLAAMADGPLGTERVILTVPLIGGDGFESLTVRDRRLLEREVAD